MVSGTTLIITILLVGGLFFGIMPAGIDCTLDAADCALIEEAGANMRNLSGLTIDELTMTMVAESADGNIGMNLTFSGFGQMAWHDGQFDMDIELTVAEQQVHFIIKDGNAYAYDTSSESWEEVPFMLDVRTLPPLDTPEAEWSGSDGVYTLTLTSASYLTSDPFIEMAVSLYNTLLLEEDLEALEVQLRELFTQMTTTDLPYTITYTIEDGFITKVQSEGAYTLLDNEAISTIAFGMTLMMSNHNGEVTIEAP